MTTLTLMITSNDVDDDDEIKHFDDDNDNIDGEDDQEGRQCQQQ